MFLFKGQFFQDYRDAVLLCIYSDQVRVFLLHKDKESSVVVKANTIELQEGDVYNNNLLNTEKILLNCSKAITTLLAGKDILKPTHLIVTSESYISPSHYVRASVKRKDSDVKISQEEIDALLTSSHSSNKKKEGAYFENTAQQFFVDGFAIEDPVGVNGKEITAHMVTTSVQQNFIDTLTLLAKNHSLQFTGFLDMQLAFASTFQHFSVSSDGVFILIFEHTILVFLMRKKYIIAIETVDIGYNALDLVTSKVLGVGLSETKKIMQMLKNKEIPDITKSKITDAIKTPISEIIKHIANTVAHLDREHLLPSNIYIGVSRYVPDIFEKIKDGEWVTDIPMERNMSIDSINNAYLHTKKHNDNQPSKVLNIFDYIILDYLF